MARSVFKTAEVFARGLVGSIPTLSRHFERNRITDELIDEAETNALGQR